MPHLQSLANDYGDQLKIYAVSYREDGDPVAYMEKYGYDFTLLLDGEPVAEAYDLQVIPALLLYDAQNNLVLDLYDVMDSYNEQFPLPDNMKHSAKAAQKAPWWADRIREALEQS